jgi:hypothetical protein
MVSDQSYGKDLFVMANHYRFIDIKDFEKRNLSDS